MALPLHAAEPCSGTVVNERQRSGGGDTEADLRKVIYDFAEFRIFAFDRDLVDRADHDSSGHGIEPIVVRGDGDPGTRRESVRIAGVDIFTSSRRTLAGDLERFIWIHRAHIADSHRADPFEPAHQVGKSFCMPERSGLGAKDCYP